MYYKVKGASMLFKLNRFLRNVVLIIGAVCVIGKLAEKKMSLPKENLEGFQTEEFDDIW